MAIPAITNAPAAPVLISSGVPYVLGLTASGTPTSWAVASGSLPTGLALNTSTGEITGTPTLAAADLAFTATITATNGEGTSSPAALKLWVLSSVPGLAANSLAFPIDFDLISRKLSVPGIGGPEPAAQPPGAGGDSTPLAVWTAGDRFPISLGIQSAGVLQEPADLSDLYLTLKRADAEDEAGLSIEVASDDFTVTGADDTARHEIVAYLDAATLSSWVGDGAVSGEGDYIDTLLKVTIVSAEDAREYSSGPTTSAIASITAEETDNHTFSITLAETLASAAYTVLCEFVCPTDTALNASREVTINASWTGSAYVVNTVSETLPYLVTESPTDEEDWDVDFSIQSINGDAAGFDVAVRTVAGEGVGNIYAIVDATQHDATIDAGTLDQAGSGAELAFKDWLSSTIGTVNLSNGVSYSAADLKTAIETAISETIESVTFDEGADTWTIRFEVGTAVAWVTDGSVAWSVAGPFYGAVYTDTFFRITVTGLAMENTGVTISSQAAPLRIFRPFVS